MHSTSHTENSPSKRHVTRWIGIGMISFGVVLLIGVAGFYAFGYYSTSQLDTLNATTDGPLTIPEGFVVAGSAQSQAALQPQNNEPEIVLPNNTVLHGAITSTREFKPVKQVQDISGFEPITAPNQPSKAVSLPQVDSSPTILSQNQSKPPSSELTAFPISNYTTDYPGGQMHPKYWGNPMWAGTDDFQIGETSQPNGFEKVAPDILASLDVDSSAAKRIRIPSIGVDAKIEPLAVVDDGDGQKYASPIDVVGSIPGTTNLGQPGNGWLFGHLESPLRGEGNVFHRLPDIPEKLTNGDPIYISLENDDGEYLYQIVSSKVIHQEDLQLYNTDDSTITLVTCSRRPFYDHRQLVTAKLVGFKPLSSG